MRKMPARQLFGAIVVAALLLPDTGYTLGLGEIEVNSALNQKLNADIELLSAAPEDVETIIVKLASRKEFSRAGLDRPYSLNDLRFKPVVINDVPYIKVSSGSPIREPFLNFLVDIDWPNGHLLREYTILLDPPVFMTLSAGAAASATASRPDNSGFRPSSSGSNNTVVVDAPDTSVPSRPTPTSSRSVPASSRPTPTSSRPASTSSRPAATSSRPAPAQTPATQVQADTVIPAPVIQQQNFINQRAGAYKVKAGDTTWSLADAMRPDQSITVPQMMLAMLRANPESFINENINGLKRGYILRIPDYDQIASISQAEALALVREQAALWRQYQQSQAGGQPVSAMKSGGSAATGKTGGSAINSGNNAYLEIVSAGSGSSTLSGKDPTKMTAQELRAELALTRERVETELVEKEALQQRVDTLQQHVEKMKGMLSIEDAELANVQSLNLPDEADPVKEMKTDEASMEDSAAAVSEETIPEEALADEEDVITDSDEAVLDETMADDAIFIDETVAEDKAMAEMLEQVAPATDDFAVAQPPIVDREPIDPLTQLLNDPVMLAAAGGGLLLFVTLIGLIIKRRKAVKKIVAPAITSGFDDLESLADDIASDLYDTEEVEQESPVVEEESVDDFESTSTMMPDSTEDTVVAEPEASTTEGGEDGPRDDVIAEADVYLAYGIYQQAEELLVQAIADNPERDDYRMKLAETHYAGKNADAFAEIASDIKQRVDNDTSPIWTKVLGMGQDLCADNPLFQGSMIGDPDIGSPSTDSPEMDFDLGIDEEAASETPDLDLTLDEEPLELPELEAEADADAEVAESTNELEFDLSDAAEVDTAELEETTDTEDEFSLDIDASELDIDVKDEVMDEAEVESIDLTDDIEENLELTDIALDEVDENSSVDDSSESVVEDIADVGLDFALDETDTDLVEVAADEDVAMDLAEEAESLDLAIDLTEESESLDISMDLTEEAESLDLAIDLTEEAESLDIAMDLTEEAELLDMDMGGDAAEETRVDSDTIEAAPAASNDFADDEDDFDLSGLDDVDEISTKLDLARAYLDMGDQEGTKGILEEVLADGDDEQKNEANELMAKLA